MKLKDTCSLEETRSNYHTMINLESILKSRDITLPTKVCLVRAMVFPVMWESDYKESWVPKNWCFWTVVLEKTLESPLNCRDIQPIYPKRNPSWIFIGRPDAESETPIFWPPDTKSQLIGKDPDAGKDFRQEEKGMTEDELIGWHHRLNGQGGMVCCSQWGHKESHMTERLNNSNKKYQGWYETLI